MLEVLPNRLYWVSLNAVPKNGNGLHFFSIDTELTYEPFFADFGPLNLSNTFRYCKLLKAILDDPQLANKRIVHFCSQCPKKRANAAYLIGAFQVMMLRRTADTAWRPFATLRPPFLPFRDATCGICTYQCTILDCLKGMEYAMRIGWFDPSNFDVATYEYYERVENGDMNWIVPDRFLAFAGPSATPIDADGFPAFTPEDYIQPFKSGNIGLVVRLNKKQYDRRRFTEAGLKHVDMYFLDGSCPPREIINKFLYIAESELPNQAIAIHCKAGLGRTGTLIGLWSQKHFQFPGRAWIGWNRICRPGSILGPQQQFLCDMQNEMFQIGAAHRAQLTGQPHQNGSSMRELNDNEQREDIGQGDRLTAAKRDSPANAGGRGNINNSLAEATSNMRGMGGRQSQVRILRGMFGPQPAIQ